MYDRTTDANRNRRCHAGAGTLLWFGRAAAALLVVGAMPLQATPLSVFQGNGWIPFANNDGYRASDGYVGPGWGGQLFDAEYLYYKLNANTLYLGLQAGFDLITGNVDEGGRTYYAGDLALSFNGVTLGDASTYEYGIDFGLRTKDYSPGSWVDMGSTVTPGLDNPGIYEVTDWNNGVYHKFHESDPFAMDAGSLVSTLVANNSGSGTTTDSKANTNGTSYYRIVAFDLTRLGLSPSNLLVDAHWTMSCGNNAINGSFSTPYHPASVPEPGELALFGAGLMALGAFRRRHGHRSERGA